GISETCAVLTIRVRSEGTRRHPPGDLAVIVDAQGAALPSFAAIDVNRASITEQVGLRQEKEFGHWDTCVTFADYLGFIVKSVRHRFVRSKAACATGLSH